MTVLTLKELLTVDFNCLVTGRCLSELQLRADKWKMLLDRCRIVNHLKIESRAKAYGNRKIIVNVVTISTLMNSSR